MGVFQNNLLAGAAAAATSGASGFYSHQIEQSCRFDSGSTSNLSRTQGTPTNADKMTVSFWVKRAKLGAAMYGMTGSGYSSGGGQYSHITFGGDGNDADKFYWLQNPQNSSGAGGTSIVLESNALFRDTGGWTNIILANDSTQSTAANRNKIYFNGWTTSLDAGGLVEEAGGGEGFGAFSEPVVLDGDSYTILSNYTATGYVSYTTANNYRTTLEIWGSVDGTNYVQLYSPLDDIATNAGEMYTGIFDKKDNDQGGDMSYYKFRVSIPTKGGGTVRPIPERTYFDVALIKNY